MNRLLLILPTLAAFSSVAFGVVADFEDLSLTSESFYNGSDSAGEFTSQGVTFTNDFDTNFFSWSGFSYSNVTDNATAGFGNQYSAFPGAGQGGQGNYGVAFDNDFAPDSTQLDFPATSQVSSIAISNSTYAALSMRDGDAFAKQFGGSTGDDPDFFKLTIQGFSAAGALTGAVDFYLADYRFADNAQDYIVDSWQIVDLTSLGAVGSLEFQLETTDVGQFGANTPFYFAIDDLSYSVVPEPLAFTLLLPILALFCRKSIRRSIRA